MTQTNQTQQEPKIRGIKITVAAPDIEQSLAELKSTAEQMGQIDVNVRDLVDKAISVAAKFGAVLKEVESGGRIEVEIRPREYDKHYHKINVEIKRDRDVVEVEVDRDKGEYEATLRINHYK